MIVLACEEGQCLELAGGSSIEGIMVLEAGTYPSTVSHCC